MLTFLWQCPPFPWISLTNYLFFQKLEPYPLASHGWRSPSKGSAKLPDLSCVLAIQMLIPTKHQHEMLVQTQRTDQWLSKGRGWGGVGQRKKRNVLLKEGNQCSQFKNKVLFILPGNQHSLNSLFNLQNYLQNCGKFHLAIWKMSVCVCVLSF